LRRFQIVLKVGINNVESVIKKKVPPPQAQKAKLKNSFEKILFFNVAFSELFLILLFLFGFELFLWVFE
jgi:hypothetical protein